MKFFPTKLCFFIGGTGLIVLRFILLLFATDATTGFFFRGYEYCGWVLTGYFILFAVALAWFSYTDGFCFYTKPGMPTYIAALVTAALLCFSAVLDLPAEKFALLGVVLKFLAAFGFALWGLGPFLKRELSMVATLCFAPVWLYELFRTFVENNDVSAVPERTFDIIMVSAVLIATLQSAKNAVGVLSRARKRFLLWIDYVAGALCFASVLPRYIIMLIGEGDKLHTSALSDPAYLAIGVFLTLYAMGSFRKSKKSSDAE